MPELNGDQFRKPRTRPFQAGSVFRRIVPPLSPMSVAPWASEDAGQRAIPVRQLVGSQKHLDPARVKHYIDHPSDEPITVLDSKGEGKLIYDGHHRAAAAMRTGQTSVNAKIRRTGYGS